MFKIEYIEETHSYYKAIIEELNYILNQISGYKMKFESFNICIG